MTATAAPRATQAAEGHPRRAFTLAEVERMLEAGVLDPDEKFELIGGEIVPMNAQRRLHGVLRSKIARHFDPRLPAGLETYQELTVRVGDEMYEPDIVVMPPQPLTRDYASIQDAVLVIEVADTSLARDRDLKAPSYAAAGLAELWIVDATDQVTLVMRTPGPSGYARVETVPFAQPLVPLCAPDASIRIADLMQP